MKTRKKLNYKHPPFRGPFEGEEQVPKRRLPPKHTGYGHSKFKPKIAWRNADYERQLDVMLETWNKK